MNAAGTLESARRQHWANQLARHAFVMGDQVALSCRGEQLTWAELYRRVSALADALAARGVVEGARVAILRGNSAEFIEILLAVTRIGAISVPINVRLTAAEIALLLIDSGASVLFVDEVTAPVARDAVSAADSGLTLIDPDEYEALIAEGAPAAPPPDVLESAPALIMYTSGTTGRSKGATLTHANLTAQATTLLTAYGFQHTGEVTLCASPLFHIGAIGSVAPAIKLGATLVILSSGAFEPGQVLDLIERERITSSFLVPTQWQMVCEEQEQNPRDLTSLRIAGWGAAPATDTLLTKMADVLGGADTVALFGQTEMSPVTCVLEGKDAIRKLNSVGRPAPGVWVRVVDADMRDVAQGEVGEIIYRGPGMMSGYWGNDEATEQALAGGWFHSGDLVRVDEEGFIYVVDRVKDMLISGGENVYSSEVENVLAGHPSVAAVSVIARPHERWGETPVAIVVLRTGRSVELEELREWASVHLARFKLPTAMEVLDALPLNAAGKVNKQALRTQFSVSGQSVGSSGAGVS